MTRTRSRNDKDKEPTPHSGGVAVGGTPGHWMMTSGGGHSSGALGHDYHRSGNDAAYQTKQGTLNMFTYTCIYYISKVQTQLVGFV